MEQITNVRLTPYTPMGENKTKGAPDFQHTLQQHRLTHTDRYEILGKATGAGFQLGWKFLDDWLRRRPGHALLSDST